MLKVPADRTLECPANTATSATGIATAADACGTVVVTFTDGVVAGCGGSKVITRTWKAVDQCNNMATGVQTITVKDVTGPVLTLPIDVVIGMPGEHGTWRDRDGDCHRRVWERQVSATAMWSRPDAAR